MLFAAEPPASMEKSSNAHPSHPPRSRMTPRRERGALVPPRSHRQRQSKTCRLPEATSGRKEKEKPETNEVAVERETGVKVQTTVVDIDSVREDEVKEENLVLLEAAEQEDGKWGKQQVYFCYGLFSCFFSQFIVLRMKKNYIILGNFLYVEFY